MRDKRRNVLSWIAGLIFLMLVGLVLFLFLGNPLPTSGEVDLASTFGKANKIVVNDAREDTVVKTIRDKDQIQKVVSSIQKYSGTFSLKETFGTPSEQPRDYWLYFYFPGESNKDYHIDLAVGDKYIQLKFGWYREIGSQEVKAIEQLLGL